jgi:hypothetical protein
MIVNICVCVTQWGCKLALEETKMPTSLLQGYLPTVLLAFFNLVRKRRKKEPNLRHITVTAQCENPDHLI